MVEVQSDEYGNGREQDIHAELFARSLEAVGLDSTYGAYLDRIPGVTLATVNLMSLFGLHRRLRGAIVGHLALFEMTSSVPNRRYGAGLRRLGFGEDACLFFDVHVVADAVHESVAAVDLAGGLAAQDRRLGADVLWGASALLAIDGIWARHVMGSWEGDELVAAPRARHALSVRRRAPRHRLARSGPAPRRSERGSGSRCGCRRRTAAGAISRSGRARWWFRARPARSPRRSGRRA